MSMYEERYITEELVNITNKKSIQNAYDRNNLSIVLHDGVHWYFECCPAGIVSTVEKEMEKHFPNYKHFAHST